MNSQDNDTEIAKQIQAQLGAASDVEQFKRQRTSSSDACHRRFLQPVSD